MELYDLKKICEIDVYDYIDLKNNPMYIRLDQKNKNYFFGVCLKDDPFEDAVKVTSIQGIERELRKHNFVYEKNTEKILRYIQNQLYP